MWTMQEDPAALGEVLMDNDFSAVLIRLLPCSHNNYLSTITATLSVLRKELDLYALMLSILDEFD